MFSGRNKMILVYNDHTDADPNPVKVGDPVQLPDVGTAQIIEIDEARQRVYVQAMGLKVLAPLNHVHARWVEGPPVLEDPPLSLFGRVTYDLAFEMYKHGKPDDHVERHVNAWTNMELLQAISDALET
jgi:hypothetical protein